MYFGDLFLTRGKLPLSSFLCFVGGFSMGSWLTLFHQLQAEKDLMDTDMHIGTPNEPEPLLFLTILIISAPTNSAQRTAIRSSWLRLSPSSTRLKHFFIIGKAGLSPSLRYNLEQEAEREEDLLLLNDLEDSFNTLSLKVLQGISLLSKNFPSLYMLKCDDDSFVRLDSVVTELEARERDVSRKQGQCFYWGYFDGRAHVQDKGKWKEQEHYILCDRYLPYALGGGYVISKTCADFIRNNHHVLKPYVNEDVTVGTWLAVISPLRRHDERFDTEWESRGCNNRYLIQHKVKESEMAEKYANLRSKGYLCSHEFRKRAGYQYEWATPPSQCCHRNMSVI